MDYLLGLSITMADLCFVLKDVDRARNWVLGHIDNQGFDTQVVLVAAFGFFTDSYALFATNIILPSLAYIYWPDSTRNQPELIINCVTLTGSACGQALFGYLADRYGRRKLYGVELIIVIFGTLGMAQVSAGTNKSMSILWWIIFWRFFVGLGIGAEYPLSAVLTAEFASTDYRAIMMATVFLMQPFGQICAAAVGWGVLTSLVKSRGLENIPVHGAKLSDQQRFDIVSTIDSVWRCVVGVGTIPALFAIIFRLSIHESPRYTMDVLNNGMGAFYDIRGHHNLETTEKNAMEEIGGEIPADLPLEGPPAADLGDALAADLPAEDPPSGGPPAADPPAEDQITAAPPAEDPPPADPSTEDLITAVPPARDPLAQVPANSAQPTQRHGLDKTPNYFTSEELHQYFIREGNWTWIAATSACWFLLDFAFYGLGIDNPRRIAAIWAPSYPSNADFQSNIQNWPSGFQIGNSTTVYSNASIPDWENPFDVETNIYRELYGDAFRYVITISIGSLVGSLVMIACINKLPRKGWLIISFIILAVLFIVMGASLRAWEFQPSHPAAITFYIVCQIFFNFGEFFK
jgi:PHS family inorganic phosphate transporter-like MFS transporter